MKIGEVFITRDVSAEIVFGEWFNKEHRITQLDLIQDMIGDLTAVYDKMLEDGNKEKDFEDVVLDDMEDTVHFKLQRILYICD